jgi:hypothetical protein
MGECDLDVMVAPSKLSVIRKAEVLVYSRRLTGRRLGQVYPHMTDDNVLFFCLTYTGFLGELEHLKIETRLIDEKFASVMG